MLRTAKNAGRADDQSGATCCITLNGAVELFGYSTVGIIFHVPVVPPFEAVPAPTHNQGFVKLFGLLLGLLYPGIRSELHMSGTKLRLVNLPPSQFTRKDSEMPRLVRFYSSRHSMGVFHWFGKRRGRQEVVGLGSLLEELRSGRYLEVMIGHCSYRYPSLLTTLS